MGYMVNMGWNVDPFLHIFFTGFVQLTEEAMGMCGWFDTHEGLAFEEIAG